MVSSLHRDHLSRGRDDLGYPRMVAHGLGLHRRSVLSRGELRLTRCGKPRAPRFASSINAKASAPSRLRDASRAQLRREPERARDATSLTLDVQRIAVAGREIRVRGGLRVSVRGIHRGRLEVLEAGDRIVLWARLRLPSHFRNPGGFDGPAYLARLRIELLGSTKSGLLVTLDEKGPLRSSFISRLRLRALRRLERVLPEESFGVVAALVTGERAGLSPELERLYQRAGIYHVMAISGAHVALWILFLHGLLRRCGVSASSSHLALLALLPLYAAFCGARPPVLRAVVMASAVLGRAASESSFTDDERSRDRRALTSDP